MCSLILREVPVYVFPSLHDGYRSLASGLLIEFDQIELQTMINGSRWLPFDIGLDQHHPLLPAHYRKDSQPVLRRFGGHFRRQAVYFLWRGYSQPNSHQTRVAGLECATN